MWIKWRKDEGSSSVEMALSCTVLMAVVFGIIQTAQLLYAYNYVAETARRTTRWAMVRGCTYSSPASSTDVQTYVTILGFPGINRTKLTATTTWPTTGAACSPCSTPCNNPGNLVRVKVQYVTNLAIPFAPDYNLTLSSTSQQVISQ